MVKETKPVAKPPAISEESRVLWQLDDNIIAFVNAMEAYAEEHDGEIPEEMDAEFSALAETREGKVDKCLLALRAYGSGGSVIKAEITRLEGMIAPQVAELKAFLQAHTAGEERLKKYLVREFSREGIKRIDASLGRMRVQPNKDRTEVVDEAEVPDRFKNVTVKMPMAEWTALCEYALIYADLREDSDDQSVPNSISEEHLDIKVVVDKNAAYSARGEDEFVTDGIPGIEFVPSGSLRTF